MGKSLPNVSYNELIKIHKLIKTFDEEEMEELDKFDKLKEDYINDEYDYLKDIHIEKEKSLFALKIGLLKYSDIREELTLSEYIIYLIILECNIQMELFRKENSFIKDLTGIPLATVEQSLKRLFDLELIYYIDESGNICLNKPLTNNQLQEWLNTHEISEVAKVNKFFPQVNDKREIVVNYEPLEDMSKTIAVSEEERLKNKTNKRAERKAKRIKDEKCNKALIAILTDTVNAIDIIKLKKYFDENYRIQNMTLWNSIESKLMEQEITIDDLIEYLKNR